MIEKGIFDKNPPITYTEAKQIFKNGDILFCSGNGIIASMIRDLTNSLFSHVAILFEIPLTKQWLVLESVESVGVRCVPMEEGYLINYNNTGRPYDGRLLVGRHSDLQKMNNRLKFMFNKAFQLIGQEYSEADIFKIANRIALKKAGIQQSGKITDNNKYICSEYVYTCFKAIGIEIPYNKSGFIAPSDIAYCSKLSLTCVIE